MFKLSIAIFLLLITTLQLHAQDSILNTPVSINLKNATLRQLLDTLSLRYQLNFAYDADALPLDSIISAESTQTPIKQLLYNTINQPNIDIAWFLGQIVIARSRKLDEQPEKMIVLNGLITDATTGEPLPYVNISIPNEPVGTTSNQMGQFEFKLPLKYIDKTVSFSNIGYARHDITIPPGNSTINISLFESNIQLPEIKVQGIPTSMIIQRMIQNQPHNYLQSFVMLNAFFREAISQDNRYVEVSEAVIDILKPAYSSNYSLEKVRFIKGRKNSYSAPSKQIQFRLQGGPYYFSRIDIARYLDFLPESNAVPIYQYTLLGYDNMYGRTTFKIGFSPIEDTGDLLYEGVLYIDTNQYALIAVDFKMTKQTLKVSRKYLIKKDTNKTQAMPYFAIYHIDYRPYQDKWILNRVKGEIKVKVKDKQNRLSADFKATTEMVITEFRPVDGDKLKNNESFKADYVLSEQINSFDADFWKNYNVIQPDEDLMNAIKERK